MNVTSLMNRATTLWKRNVSSHTPDYVAADSLVNRIREAGLGPGAAAVAGGAALGTAVGFAKGVQNLTHDQVTVQTQHFEAMKPVLVGAHYVPEDSTWHPTYDSNMNLTGGYYTYDGNYFRSITQDQHTGLTWDKQVQVHSMDYGPIKGALLGAGIGAAGGLAVGIGASIIDGILHRDDDPWSHRPNVPQTEWQRRLARGADHAPLVGGVAGGAAGALLGLQAAHIAGARNTDLTQTWQQPVMETRVIGWIPNASTRHEIPSANWDGRDVMYDRLAPGQFGDPPFQGQRAVEESVPTGAYKTMTTTDHAYSLSPLGGVLFGATVGVLGGVAAGVALGIIAKAISGEDPPRD